MAETTADVRRDIERTRERMSTTLEELEQRLNVVQVVRDHPWPALAVAFGAGLVLAGTGADRRATEATHDMSRAAGGRVGSAIDGLLGVVIGAARGVIEDKVDALVKDVRASLRGSPPSRARASRESPLPIGDGNSVSAMGAPRAD